MNIKTWQDRAIKNPGWHDTKSAMQAEIDELRAELNDEIIRCTQADNAVEKLAAELGDLPQARLIAENAALHENRHAREDVISALKDELSALRNQEPVAWGVFHEDGSAHIFQQKEAADIFGEAKPLYLLEDLT